MRKPEWALLLCPWRCFAILRLAAPTVEPTLFLGSKHIPVTQKHESHPVRDGFDVLVAGVGLVSSRRSSSFRFAPYEPFTVQVLIRAAHIRKKGPIRDPFYRIGCGSRI